MDEETFQKLLKKVRGSASRDQLANAVLPGLERTLQRPEHSQLLAELQTKATNIIGNLPADNPCPGIRQAAVRCVLLLETAHKKAGPFIKPKSWRKPVIIFGAAATALLYVILFVTRD